MQQNPQANPVRRLGSLLCSLALVAFTPASHAQSGAVVIQIRVSVPTCAVAAGQMLVPGELPIQLDPRCRVASVITQTQAQAPTNSTGTTSKSVIQISYQ